MLETLSLQTSLLQTLGWTLLHSLWQGALIAALLFFVLLFVKSSQIRYVISCAALLLMILVPVVTFGMLFDKPTPSVETDAASDVLPTPQSLNVDMPVNADPLQPLPQAGRANGIARTAPWDEPFWRQRVTDYLPFVVVAWLSGVVLLSLRLLLQWLYAERFKRRHTNHASSDLQQLVRVLALRLCVSRPVQLLESSLVDAPTVIGFLKPVILLPTSALTGLTMQQLESLLAHELAHIRRHDYLVNILQSVIETLLFYHPAVWWVSQRVRIEREHCCDDVAVGVSGSAVVYAKALERLETLRQQPNLAMAANGVSLVKRIRRLVAKPATQTRFPASWLISFSMLAVLMVGTGFWIYPQLTEAQTAPTSFQVFDRNGEELTEDTAPHAFGMIKNELVDKFGTGILEQNLKVYSTIDLQAQQAANEASLNAEMPPGAQMAVVGIDPSTGEILAMVGEYLKKGQEVGDLNRAAQSYRQLGHSFTPLVYATAFEQAGFTQATILNDVPTSFKQPGQADYKPENHDNTFMGSMTVRKSLDISRNVPAIKLMEEVTPEAVVTKAQELGYENVQPYWSTALGSFEATPLKHAAAFGSFANGGVYIEPHIIVRVEDAAGKVLFETIPVKKQVWSEQTAYLTLDLMHGNAVDPGAFSLRAAIDGRYVAGKTGTTNEQRDIWFVGMTPGMVATVWIGFDDNSRLPIKIDPGLTRAGDGTVNSSRQPIYIWKEFVEAALRGKPAGEFSVPEGIVFKNIDLTTGEEGSTKAAFVAQADESMMQPEPGMESSSTDNSEPEMEAQTEEGFQQIWVSAVGSGIKYSEDFSEILQMKPDDIIIVEERQGDSAKQLIITQPKDSSITYAYTLNGKEQQIDDGVMTWYEDIWKLIANANITGDFGSGWQVDWSQSDDLTVEDDGSTKVKGLSNAFGYKEDGNGFISYVKETVSGFPAWLSDIQIADFLEEGGVGPMRRLIDMPDVSARGYILQAVHVLNHQPLIGSRFGSEAAVKPYVNDLLKNVPLTLEDLQAIFQLIETVKNQEIKKELLLKYLEKVSSQ